MTLPSILLIGFLLGMKHALESDHLAAVATLATRQHSLLSMLRQGVAWGVGHTLTLLLVGGAILTLGAAIPRNIERALEICVGVMLIGLGMDVIRRVMRQRVHFHVHRHESGQIHWHAHTHDADPSAAVKLPDVMRHRTGSLPPIRLPADHSHAPHEHQHAHTWPVRALAVGVMHGLAGSAALILLSLESVASVPMGIAYISLFGVGSITGMALLSVAIAIPLRWSSEYFGRCYRALVAAIGIGTIGIGGWIVYCGG